MFVISHPFVEPAGYTAFFHMQEHVMRAVTAWQPDKVTCMVLPLAYVHQQVILMVIGETGSPRSKRPTHSDISRERDAVRVRWIFDSV
jgi:hypothetical protein